MIAGLVPRAHVTVDLRSSQSVRHTWAAEKVINAKSSIAGEAMIESASKSDIRLRTRIRRSRAFCSAITHGTAIPGRPHLASDSKTPHTRSGTQHAQWRIPQG